MLTSVYENKMTLNIRERHLVYRRQCGGEWFDFEQIVREVYRHAIRCGDTAVDAGANFGSHTMQIAQLVGGRGRVLAIEAVPVVAETLERSIREGYGHLAGRIEVLNRAVSDRPGSLDFYHVPSNHALSSFRDRPNVHAEKAMITVEAVRIDDLIRPDEHVGYMKLDVEGAELSALKGAPSTLRRSRPVITFEFDTVTAESFGNTAKDYVDFLHRAGYRIFDPFGNRMVEQSEFQQSLVWDYVALAGAPEQENSLFSALWRYMLQHFGVTV